GDAGGEGGFPDPGGEDAFGEPPEGGEDAFGPAPEGGPEFIDPFASGDGNAPPRFDPNAFGPAAFAPADGEGGDGGEDAPGPNPFGGFLAAPVQTEAFDDFGEQPGNAGNFFFQNVLGPAAPGAGGFGPAQVGPGNEEGGFDEPPEGAPAPADGEFGPAGPPSDGAGWQGPTFEFDDDGGLKGDFFAPQQAFSLGQPASPGGVPGGSEGGLPPDPLGEFFGEFLGPEGEPGAAGLEGGPNLAEGVQAFFDPSQEGGFNPNDFFEDARGAGGPAPFAPGAGPGGEPTLDADGEPVEGFNPGGPGGGFVPGLAFEDQGVDQFQPPVAFDMGEGGQAMAWEDGMSQVRRDDGSMNVFWGDGKALEREVLDDGAIRQVNPDGTEMLIAPDGSAEFQSISGEAVVRERTDDGFRTTRPDGGLVFEGEDGSKSFFEPSGWSREQVVDPETGAMLTRGSDGLVEVVNPDGTFNRINPDGTQDQAFFGEEGEFITQNGDGSQRIVRSDGTEEFQDASGYGGKKVQSDDGSFVTLMTDGASKMEAEDGSWAIEVAPNGEQTVTSTLEDGTIQKNLPDGGVQRYNPEIGATTFTTPEGGDYITRENPDGSVVVTDPTGMVTESDPVTGSTLVTFADGSVQSTERLEDGSLATTTPTGDVIVTAPDGSQTVVTAEGEATSTEVSELEDGSKLVVATKADGTQKSTQVAEDGSLTTSWSTDAPADGTVTSEGDPPEGAGFADGEAPEAPPVPKGLQVDPESGQTTVLLSSGEAVGHTLGEDGVLTLQSTATDPTPGGPDEGSGEADGVPDEEAGEADGVPDEEAGAAAVRLAVINPAVGEVITEGDTTLVESTFTDAGGVAMEVAPPPGEPDAAPAEVAISADGTQQAITSPTGETATAKTSDTGVVIAMGEGPMQATLANLDPGDQQPLVTADGASVTAAPAADGSIAFLDADGNPAIKEDGTAYTADDMAAMVVAFDEE
ncbi:MAG: hypothetical protein VX522_01005, partial [Actinomycetota bacterium]|nr:hypothetical protein [Actinomycetota bacterium]